MAGPYGVVTDPVCGMRIKAAGADAVEYGGRTYYFCETACADTFRDDPERWIDKEARIQGAPEPAGQGVRVGR